MATTGKAKKVASTVAAVAAAAALMLGGTLAWQSANQTALNEASDVINPGGRLHDDFYIDANGDYNADIYVENFDKEDIFARVQLQEYMEVIMNYGTAGEKNYLVLGEQDEAMDGSSINIRTREIDENTTEQLYEREYATHSAYAPDSSVEQAGADYRDAADPANYWEWTMGSADSEEVYYMPTFNKNKDSLVADRNGMYVDRIGGISNWGPQQYEDYTIWQDGDTDTGNAIYDDDTDDIDDVKYDFENLTQYIDAGNITTVEETHTAKAVGKTNDFISMTEWLAKLEAGENTADYWVYDDTDENGWIYWSSPIKPDTATGLLLDSIELKDIMDDTWYYAINVIAQFVTADDVGKFEGDGTGFYDTEKGSVPTENAEKLLEAIGVNMSGEVGGDDPIVTTDFAVKVSDYTTGNSWTIKNGSLDLTPNNGTAYSLSLVSDSYTADDFTWEITDITADSSSLNPNGDGTYYLNFPADGDNGTYVVVTVTNIEDASKAATLKVTLDQDDEFADPEPDPDETDPIVLSVKAEPDWYIPNVSNNSIALTAELTDNGAPIEMGESPVQWNISAAARAMLGEYTQLTDNGDGTATLAIDPTEQNNVLVTASYTHTDGKERTGEILITNGPRLASMGAYDLDEGKFVGSVDFLPDGGTYNLKLYFFPNYTGTVQPVEDAYTGDAADILASRLSVYACESIDDHVQIPDPEGVTIEQDTDDPSLVTVTIDPGVSESFHILFDVENGMQMPFSFDVAIPELVWTGASQQDPNAPVYLAPGESATYQLINVGASCAEADIIYSVWSGNASDSGNFIIARDADDARIATITHGCEDDSCTCGEDYYFVSASGIPGIADDVVSPNAISISAIDYVIYDHTYDSYHYSANGVPSTLTEGDYTVYLTSGKDIKYTGNGAGFDWSSDYITITDNAVAAIPDEEGAYYVTASFTLDSSIPTGVYYINATNNAGESWSIPIEWNNPADDTLYSLYAWAVDENDRSTDTYTQGGEPAVYIKANVWDDDVSDYVYGLTEDSITWTIEGDSTGTAYMSFVKVDEDGSYIAKLNPGDAQEAITITAAYTAPDGSELTAPVNLNVIFKASDYFTLDDENTSLVHPANNYDMVYTDADGETGYTFEITDGSGVASIDGNVLTIIGDAPEFAKIAIAVKNADGDTVDTIDLSVSHDITFKSVYDGETTILINGSPTNVYAGADYTAWLGNDVQLALGIPSQPEGYGPIYPEMFEDYGVVPEYRDGDENGDIIRYTFNQSGISASITGTYTYGEDFIIEDFSAVDILWAHSVGVEYSLNGGERIPYDETTLFLEDGDTLTLYATSFYMDGSASDPQPTEYSWFIGEHGNNPTYNEAAFGSLTNGYAPDGLSYSIVSVNDMETDLRYDIRVSTDLHNDVTVNILKGDPAIDGPTEVEVDSQNDYGTNTLRDYTFSINAPEDYAYFDDWYLVVTPEAEAVIGQTYTITATPDGHDGSELTMDVTIVAHDYSYVSMYVDGEESYQGNYGDEYGTYFILSADAADKYGYPVDESELVWTVTSDNTGEDITDAVLTDNGDGDYGIELSGRTDNVCVKVEYPGENQGKNSSAMCTFYYEGEGGYEPPTIYLNHIEMATAYSEYPLSTNSNGDLVPIIDLSGDNAVYLTAKAYNSETGEFIDWGFEEVTWSSTSQYLDASDLGVGLIRSSGSGEMSAAMEPITITATANDGSGSANFTVYLYDDAVHELKDTLYTGNYWAILQPVESLGVDADHYCVYRTNAPLPYCMLELKYTGDELNLYELAEHYDSYIVDPGALYPSSDYIGICGHPNGANGNYPQDEAPLFSAANSLTSQIYASAISSGETVYGILPGTPVMITSTRLADNWNVSEEVNSQQSFIEGSRAYLSFTVPPTAAPHSEIVLTQTDTERDETFTITISVADPGPYFYVYINGDRVYGEGGLIPNNSEIDLPMSALTEDTEIKLQSTYPTNQDVGWEVTDYNEAYIVGESTDEYTYTFTIPAGTVSADYPLHANQYANDNWWGLVFRAPGAGSDSYISGVYPMGEMVTDEYNNIYIAPGESVEFFFDGSSDLTNDNVVWSLVAYDENGETSSHSFTIDTENVTNTINAMVTHNCADEENCTCTAQYLQVGAKVNGSDMVVYCSSYIYPYAYIPALDSNGYMHLDVWHLDDVDSEGNPIFSSVPYLQPGVDYTLEMYLNSDEITDPSVYLNTGVTLEFTVTDMHGNTSVLTDYVGGSAEGLTFLNNGAPALAGNSQPDDKDHLHIGFKLGDTVEYGSWVKIAAKTTSEEIRASGEVQKTVTQDEVELNVKLYDQTTGVEVTDYFVAENTTYDVVATLERGGETYTVHSSNEDKYPLSTNIEKVYDEFHYFVLHDYDFMENQEVAQVTLNDDGTITVGSDDPDYQGEFIIVITVNDLRLLDDEGSVEEHLYARGQTNYYFPGEAPLTIFASPLTVNEFDPILGKDVHILRVYEDGFETTFTAQFVPNGDFIDTTDIVYTIVSECTDPNTRIAGDTLIIGKDETATEITVKGVSEPYKAQGTISIELDYTKPWYVEVAETVPGSADTVAIDGVEWYVLSNENGVAELLAANAVTKMAWDADGVRDDGLHPLSYTGSDVVNYLNGEFLDTLTTVRSSLVPSGYTVKNWPANADDNSDYTEIQLSDDLVTLTILDGDTISDAIEADMVTRYTSLAETGDSVDNVYKIWRALTISGTDTEGVWKILHSYLTVHTDRSFVNTDHGTSVGTTSNYVHPVIFVDLYDAGMPTPQVVCDTAADDSVTLACGESAEFRFSNLYLTNADVEWFLEAIDEDGNVDETANYSIACTEGSGDTATLTHSCVEGYCTCDGYAYRVGINYEEYGKTKTLYGSTAIYHEGGLYKELTLVSNADRDDYTNFPRLRLNTPVELLDESGNGLAVFGNPNGSYATCGLKYYDVDDLGLLPIMDADSSMFTYDESTHTLTITDESLIGKLCVATGWDEDDNSITRYFWLVGEDGTLPYSLSVSATANKYPVGGSLSVTYTASAVDANGEEVPLRYVPTVYWKVTTSSGFVAEDNFISIFPTGYDHLTLDTTGYTDSYTIEAYLGGAAAEPLTLTPEPDGTGEPSFSVAYVDGGVIGSGYAPNSTVTVTPGTEIQLYSSRSSTTWSVTGATEAKAGYNASSGSAGSYYHVTVPALADAGSDITVTQTVDGEEYSIVLRLEGAPVFVDEDGKELASVVNVTPGQVITFRTANALTNSDYSITPDNGALTAEQIDSTFFRWIVTIPSDAETGDSYIFNCIAQPNGSNSRYDVLVTFVVE